MLIEEEGWPLGLQPLNVRIGLGRARDYFGSMSFNTTMLTGSPTSSTDSSSDLDTESTGSFFHDRSITLGSLIGVSSILELSRRSIRGRRSEPLKVKKPCKAKPWIFSLCSRDSIDVKSSTTNTPSLGQFLAVERRAANNQSNNVDVPDEITMIPQQNSLFVDGRVAPPRSSPLSGLEGDNGDSEGIDHGNNNGHGVPVLFSCMCGQDTH
ncbi:hypothetical protein SOVF_126910 isoform B [Spinacia oleracea]|uniref:Uncharacterized protein At3g17950 isoform X2 n=1 Tax=Spinacia oleracea TaxID=3562 RepID=A0A9R0JNY7_SPIOL|nr:uncharacterized protein At3g17950-like isoform X2 [Spinacia oleracea]KNA12287.1 hypothetical protein SOVF_126910 isoform B [Spinacia oleracea]